RSRGAETVAIRATDDGADRDRRPRDRRERAPGRPRRRRASPDGEGVRPAVVPREPPGCRLLARGPDGARVGLPGRRRHRHGHRPYPSIAREDRARSVEAGAPADRVGRRLPVPGMTWLAVLVATASLA